MTQVLKTCEDEDIVSSVLNESKHLIKAAFSALPLALPATASPSKAHRSPLKSPAKTEPPKYRCSAEEFLEQYENYLVNE